MRRIWEEGDERVDRTGVGTRSVFGARTALRSRRRARAAAHHQAGVLEGRRARDAVVPYRQHQHPPAAGAGRDDLERLAARPATARRAARQIRQEDFEARIVADEDVRGALGRSRAGATASSGSIGRRTSRRARAPSAEARASTRSRRWSTSLKANPGSRRHIIEGWNVAELDRMALPPCHKTYQFHVAGDRLSCLLYQRSCDVALGLPFNLFGAALLTRMIAQPGRSRTRRTDLDGRRHAPLSQPLPHLVEEQLSREPAGEPMLAILRQAGVDLRLPVRGFRGPRVCAARRNPAHRSRSERGTCPSR